MDVWHIFCAKEAREVQFLASFYPFPEWRTGGALADGNQIAGVPYKGRFSFGDGFAFQPVYNVRDLTRFCSGS